MTSHEKHIDESPSSHELSSDPKQQKLASEITYADDEEAATSDGKHGALRQTLKSRHMQMIAVGYAKTLPPVYFQGHILLPVFNPFYISGY
jgi:amino acid permease